jgi:hypothetical protein
MNRHDRRAARKTQTAFIPCTSDNLAKAIALCEQVGQAGHAELFRAAREGKVAIAFATDRRVMFSKAELSAAPLPTIIIISDDDDFSTGPAGWKCASMVAEWARGAYVHAAGATRESYRDAIDGALLLRRFVLVETSSQRALAWAALLKNKPAKVMLPRDGVHPIAPNRGVMH